eukprot:FR736349.1.p1 GENE.FR736349.1~~FR736349.1.p1  ORF type:complete len:100 (+),score=46.99 FR736349.1:932-1231(+)
MESLRLGSSGCRGAGFTPLKGREYGYPPKLGEKPPGKKFGTKKAPQKAPETLKKAPVFLGVFFHKAPPPPVKNTPKKKPTPPKNQKGGGKKPPTRRKII